MIPGLYYVKNYLTNDEIDSIEKFIEDSDQFKGIHKTSNSRRVLQYGYSYGYDKSRIDKIEEIPKIFKDLVEPERISKAGKQLFKKDEELEQLIINEYKPGQGIAYHTDHEKYFGPKIACISVGADIEINFVNKLDENNKKTLKVEKGSMYVMCSDSRYKWKHGIDKKLTNNDGSKRGTRYSLTYRTIQNGTK